jgi:hypothetical protein
VTNDQFKGSLQNGQFTQTFTSKTKITGQGPGNNLAFFATFHVTFNANGEITSIHTDNSAECG